MWKDEIVEEVRNARLQIGAEFGDDLHRIVENLRKMQVASGHKVVTMEPRPPRVALRATRTATK
jgi:hypothetical protein